MPEIKLTKGKVAIVDEEFYPLLSSFKWNAHNRRGKYYASRCASPQISMHRFIMNAPDDMQVDHINGDSLDNRRSNLRLCTAKQNNRNASKRKDNTSGFKGVSYYAKSKKWRAYIFTDKKWHGLGYYKTPEEAYEVYKKKALELFGEFANV